MPSSPDPPALVIVGASVRSAAHSARRAGFLPHAADAYADRDLLTHAQLIPVTRFPHSLPHDLAPLPATPWLYTGGLENHPPLLDTLAQWGPLWGNSAATVAAIRDPARLARLRTTHGLPTLAVCPADQPPPPLGDWMLKPLAGSAGRGVVRWTPATLDHPTRAEPHVFQRRVSGRPGSALFLAGPHHTRCLGVTWQLDTPAGHPWPHAWSGNLLPPLPPAHLGPPLTHAGEVLAHETGLRGLFGIDFLDDGTTPWIVEINPRYTGSTELFEFRTQTPLLWQHAQACDPRATLPALPAIDAPAVPHNHCLGKAIVYAPAAARLMVDLPLPPPTPLWTFPELADLPAGGQIFAPGDPVCSVFAHAPTEAECLEELQSRTQRVLALLAPQ